MNRREFLNSTLATTLVGGAVVGRPAAQQTPLRQTATQPRPYPGTTREIPMHAYSRYLQWLRTPEEVASACREISCRSLMVTVQDGASAHVQQAAVTSELPTFVNALRSEGIDVKMIRGGGQTAVDADVERLVGTMADLGITHYWLGNDSYDLSQPLMPQLDAIKRKVEGFVSLNERHGATLVYHTRSGTRTVGAGVWDLLSVFQDFDPQRVGFHWDTGHMSLHGPMWESLIRAAGPYLSVVSWKDRTWEQDLGRFVIEGGFYPGPEVQQEGGGGGRGGGGRGGGGAPSDPLDEVPRPLAGEHFARGMGWSSEDTPLGTGVVDFFRYGEVLGEMGFNGLMDMQAEYEGLGGAERGQTALTVPRRAVLGALKRDVLTVRAALAQSGSGIMV
jgi:sugar phosphate isomerase/epimerase